VLACKAPKRHERRSKKQSSDDRGIGLATPDGRKTHRARMHHMTIQIKKRGVEMSEQSKPRFAVVTGASSGIGLELAPFASEGWGLLIAAENAEIKDVARQIGPNVKAVQADLSTYDGVEKLWEAIQLDGRQVDAAAINAGVGVGGDFTRDTELEAELKMIDLNVKSTVHLGKRVLQQMVPRGEGRLLFTSSIASTMPTPYQAVYGATKAFVQSLSQSLKSELKDTGVTVTALMPGATDTDFFRRAGMEDTKVGTEGKNENDPKDVARQGYDAMMEGADRVFSASFKTKVEGETARFMPESVKAEMHRKQAEPGSARKR
jgi:short-subunit dehydrogenase